MSRTCPLNAGLLASLLALAVVLPCTSAQIPDEKSDLMMSLTDRDTEGKVACTLDCITVDSYYHEPYHTCEHSGKTFRAWTRFFLNGTKTCIMGYCKDDGSTPMRLTNCPHILKNRPSTTPAAPRECFPDQQKCVQSVRWSQHCVHKSKFCDGIKYGCPDNSDELFCEQHQCLSGYLKCADRRQCKPERDFCNGRHDCKDKSDEQNCECRPGHWKCKDGSRCISAGWFCDGGRDCGDGSDEPSGCHRRFMCNPGMTRCADLVQCVIDEYICDGHPHCNDGSDEQGCALYNCIDGYRKCADQHQCIPDEQFCNGDRNCKDGSDELNCYGYY